MKSIEDFFSRIERENKHIPRRELFPIDSFHQKIYYSGQLLNASYSKFKRFKKGSKKNNLLREARKNFVINCVTAIEVYYKDLVRVTPEMSDKIRRSASIKELLSSKEKVNLWEAYQIFKEKDLKLGDLLIYYFTFQNLEEINLVMSKLLNLKNYLSDIEQHTLKLDKGGREYFNLQDLCLSRDFPNWKSKISEIFNIRHDYIHHINLKDKLGDQKLFDLFLNIYSFILIADDHYFKTVPEE